MNRMRGLSLPHMTQEAYDKTVQAFSNRPVKDDSTLITIGRYEGYRQVLDFLKQFVSDSYTSGTPEDIDVTKQEYKPSQRLFKKLNRSDNDTKS